MLLSTPFTLPNGTKLPNRLLKSAMSEALGTVDNRVTPALVTLYDRWARGGTGGPGHAGRPVPGLSRRGTGLVRSRHGR